MTQEELKELEKLRSARGHLRAACDEALARLDQDIAAAVARCDHLSPNGLSAAAENAVAPYAICELCKGKVS